MGDNIPDNAIEKVEWWVVRIWQKWVEQPDGSRVAHVVHYDQCAPWVQVIVNGLQLAGKCIVMPGSGVIAEPVECFEGIEGQLKADVRRGALAEAYPGRDFRVVMNADV